VLKDAPDQLVRVDICSLGYRDEIEHVHLSLARFDPPHKVVAAFHFCGELTLTKTSGFASLYDLRHERAVLRTS